MKKTISAVLLAIVLLLNGSAAVFAQIPVPVGPVGQCPTGFEPHDAMMHDMPDHQHAGLTVDLNGDGTICVKHVTETIHVHVDNVVR
jgi:hypothetical protein